MVYYFLFFKIKAEVYIINLLQLANNENKTRKGNSQILLYHISVWTLQAFALTGLAHFQIRTEECLPQAPDARPGGWMNGLA